MRHARTVAGSQLCERTLDAAIWRSAATGLALWSITLGLIAVPQVGDRAPAIAAMHLLTAAFGLLTSQADRARPEVRLAFLVLLAATLVLDVTRSEVLVVETCAAATFVVLATALLVLPLPLGALFLIVTTTLAGVAAHQDDRTGAIVAALTLVPLIYGIAAGVLSCALRRFARTVDTHSDVSRRQEEELLAAQMAERTAVDYRRLLHDTAINTLAALAAERPVGADPALIRARCAQDVAALGAETREARRPLLQEVAEGLDVAVVWAGEDPAAVPALVEVVPVEVSAALQGVIRELLINVEKHAHATRTVIEIHSSATSLTVTVSDDGAGFEPAEVARRGLLTSVEQRAAEVGIDVDLDSRPGHGTVARVTVPLTPPAPRDPTPPSEVRRLRRAGMWGWCIAVAVAAALSTLLAGGDVLGIASPVLVIGLVAAARFDTRRTGILPRRTAIAIAIGVPVAHVVGSVAARQDQGADAALWQVIGLAPLLILLLDLAASRRSLTAAVTLLVATAAVRNLLPGSSGPPLTALDAMHVGLALAQLAVWVVFARHLEEVGAQADRVERRMIRRRAALDAQRSAVAIRDHWSREQIRSAVDFLQAVADGELRIDAPEVRRRADLEEHHLRQLLNLHPDLVHLGPWLARAIGTSRARGTRLQVRVGGRDLPTAEAAEAMGEILLRLLEETPTGEEVVITSSEGVRPSGILIVGPPGFADPIIERTDRRGHRLTVTRLERRDLVEFDVEAPQQARAIPDRV